MVRIAVIALKGGVGKSTTTACLADYVANSAGNPKTLIIDGDPQSTMKAFFGLQVTGIIDFAEFFLGEKSIDTFQPVKLQDATIDVMVASKRLSDADTIITGFKREERLKNRLDDQVLPHEFLFFDTAPSITITTWNILLASDYIIIPVTLDVLSMHAVNATTDAVVALKKAYGYGPSILGILPTMHDLRSTISAEALTEIKEFAKAAKIKVFSPIGVDALVKRSQTKRQSLFEMPSSRAAQQYAAVGKYLLSKVKGSTNG